MQSRTDHKDRLDGILLGVYEKELERLSNIILKNLQHLISLGIIEIRQEANGEPWYRVREEYQQWSVILEE